MIFTTLNGIFRLFGFVDPSTHHFTPFHDFQPPVKAIVSCVSLFRHLFHQSASCGCNKFNGKRVHCICIIALQVDNYFECEPFGRFDCQSLTAKEISVREREQIRSFLRDETTCLPFMQTVLYSISLQGQCVLISVCEWGSVGWIHCVHVNARDG